ncbi:hypothetical protein CCUS01_14129 [Colletotrichum cuscutae]|uniref:Uncharacterized protein n=1 Tax=Colletotrichum cuscutae TaxID=1209917 RepID=A0AAI9Y9X5_9PEZI|nr:hypothetical protein CCUS01_14129 [Colletotrichum cuscutae]
MSFSLRNSSEEVDTPDPGRHAHAMNEERKHFPVLRSEPKTATSKQDSSSARRTISVTPLGVVSKHDPPRHLKGQIQKPLNLIFPKLTIGHPNGKKFHSLDIPILQRYTIMEIFKSPEKATNWATWHTW